MSFSKSFTRRPSCEHDRQPGQVTPEGLYLKRRQIMAGMAGAGVLLANGLGGAALAAGEAELDYRKRPDLAAKDELTPFDKVTTYNNFYEFGIGKEDPAANAGQLRIDPWSVQVDGLAENTGRFDLQELLQGIGLEERIYRLRCVEAWSMVVPWVGFPLSAWIERFQPQPEARYLRFTTLHDPAQMPGQRRAVIPWPYVEGLRMDEAMHPLAILAVGLYGKPLPRQNGAPLRLVVPWKYGFKSIKSIVRIEFLAEQPTTTWALSAPSEYGFYANVNPAVDHPRWSQASERRIGPGYSLFNPRIDTLPFNGYAEQVASLYEGMDLEKHF